MIRPAFENKAYEQSVIDSIPLKRYRNHRRRGIVDLFSALGLVAVHITGEILNINGGSVLCG